MNALTAVKRLTATLVIILWAAGIASAAPAPMLLSPCAIVSSAQDIQVSTVLTGSHLMTAEHGNLRLRSDFGLTDREWAYTPNARTSHHSVPDSVLILLTGSGIFAMAFIVRRQRSGLLP